MKSVSALILRELTWGHSALFQEASALPFPVCDHQRRAHHRLGGGRSDLREEPHPR